MPIAPPPDDMQVITADAVDRLVSRIHSLERTRAFTAEPPIFDRSVWDALAQDGWIGLGVPEALGGAGLPLDYVCTVVESLAQSLAPDPFIACGVMPAALLRRLDTPAHPLLAEIIAGERLVTIAWQENERAFGRSGFDIDCEFADGKVTGFKRKVPAAALADDFLVLVRNDGAPALARIASGVPGIRIVPQRLTHQFGFADLSIEGAPAELFAIGEGATDALDKAITEGRIANAASDLAFARRALAVTIDYTAQRKQFGKSIASFQAVQHQLVDLRVSLELAAATLRAALARWELDAGAAHAASAACKTAALSVVRSAVQLHGAMGYAEEADIGLYMKAVMENVGWLGTPDQHAAAFLDRQSGSNGNA